MIDGHVFHPPSRFAQALSTIQDVVGHFRRMPAADCPSGDEATGVWPCHMKPWDSHWPPWNFLENRKIHSVWIQAGWPASFGGWNLNLPCRLTSMMHTMSFGENWLGDLSMDGYFPVEWSKLRLFLVLIKGDYTIYPAIWRSWLTIGRIPMNQPVLWNVTRVLNAGSTCPRLDGFFDSGLGPPAN